MEPEIKTDKDVAYDIALEGLKEKVNELVWIRLPGTITLARSDELANQIFDLIVGEWKP